MTDADSVRALLNVQQGSRFLVGHHSTFYNTTGSSYDITQRSTTLPVSYRPSLNVQQHPYCMCDTKGTAPPPPPPPSARLPGGRTCLLLVLAGGKLRSTPAPFVQPAAGPADLTAKCCFFVLAPHPHPPTPPLFPSSSQSLSPTPTQFQLMGMKHFG